MEQNRLTLFLNKELTRALLLMSQSDFRSPIQEAVWILRQEASRRGLFSQEQSDSKYRSQPVTSEPVN